MIELSFNVTIKKNKRLELSFFIHIRDIIHSMYYSPWNVLLSHLNGERTMSERWTNAERTQSERCVNAERNLVNDVWTVNGERTQKRTERKRER